MFFLASILPWSHHQSILQTVNSWMKGDGGYAVLFGLLFSCGVGVPLPEDIPLLLAGYFVAIGEMNLAVAGVCAWCGIIAGDCVLYFLGRRFGMNITKIPVIGSHIRKEKIEKVHQMFEKYGIWVVAVGRLFAGIRGVMVFTAGMIRFRFWQFIIADGLAAIVSGGLFIALGYYAGKKLGNLESVRDKIELYQRWVLLGVVLIVTGYILWSWWRRKSKQSAHIPSPAAIVPGDIYPPG